MERTQHSPTAPRTLGDVLYSSSSQPLVSEKNWGRLAELAAGRDAFALHALYERAHRPVFTLIVRLTSNQETAEELTLDVFDDMWRGASRYDRANGTVLGWIMSLARSKAIDWLRLEQQQRRPDSGSDGGLLLIDTPDYRDVLKFKEQSARLRAALALLTPEERAAIELAFFSELTHVQVAGRLKRPSSTVKAWIRSGLHKLRQVDATNACDQSQAVCAHAIGALPPLDVASIEAHLSSCWQCRRERESLRSVVNAFAAWPVDVLRPAASLKKRIGSIASADGNDATASTEPRWSAPEWENVAPGISCKLLATNTENHLVSMLVRLAPGGEYPPHTHAGLEELHLLDGELWIDERKLHAGDYNRAEPGTTDKRVWSETGCTCMLITSTRDALR